MTAALALVLLAFPFVAHVPAPQSPGERVPGRLELQELQLENGETVLSGTYDVWEKRSARQGRVLSLAVAVLPARSADPRPDPVVLIAGGPGQGGTAIRYWRDSWMRDEHDLVLFDQRGTGRSNPLHCELSEGPEDVQSLLDPIFQPERFRACLDTLRGRADLTQYSTPIAMDDLDELLTALGYGEVNLVGGSYGTRAALVFLRRHGQRVRTATLTGVAPLAFRNPLFHARGAQLALERTLAACAADPDCAAAFPDLERETNEVFERLRRAPARVEGLATRSGTPVSLTLDAVAFGEALRILMYRTAGTRGTPFALHEAFVGRYEELLALGLASARGVRESLAFGMLLSVTCAEDLARIEEREIEVATRGTFLGASRVREQRAVCAFWPQGELPENYGDPVESDVPVLLLSGRFDPVTPPECASEAARHLANSLHLVFPAAHGVGGPCVDGLRAEFLREGSTADLDTSCVAEASLGAFRLR